MSWWCYMAVGAAVAFLMQDGFIPQLIACVCLLAVFSHIGSRIEALEKRRK